LYFVPIWVVAYAPTVTRVVGVFVPFSCAASLGKQKIPTEIRTLHVACAILN
jgi:hypothetical protein